MLPVDDALAAVGERANVPVPSEPTMICGEDASVVSVLVAVERSLIVNVEVPAELGAVSPELKPLSP